MQAHAVGLDFRLTRRRIIIAGSIVVALVCVVLLYRTIDIAALHERAAEINGVLVFASMTVLPLIGFPVSVTHAVAGVRFGFGLGLALVAVSIVLQLLASYALVKAMPKLFARHLKPLRDRLPQGTHAPLTQFTILLPGVPYFAKNYVLPLAGVPLGIYLLWGIPLHIAKSAIGVVFGEMSDELTPLRVAGFVTYTLCITVGCAWLFRRLQKRMKEAPPRKRGKWKRRTSS
jgi:uncharacterized membrane protein YdjX (TVP38/TMEM64 family)